jgi:hypothetical protein
MIGRSWGGGGGKKRWCTRSLSVARLLIYVCPPTCSLQNAHTHAHIHTHAGCCTGCPPSSYPHTFTHTHARSHTITGCCTGCPLSSTSPSPSPSTTRLGKEMDHRHNTANTHTTQHSTALHIHTPLASPNIHTHTPPLASPTVAMGVTHPLTHSLTHSHLTSSSL